MRRTADNVFEGKVHRRNLLICMVGAEKIVPLAAVFSPFIFQSLGTKFQGELGSLLATVIAGTVQVGSFTNPDRFQAILNFVASKPAGLVFPSAGFKFRLTRQTFGGSHFTLLPGAQGARSGLQSTRDIQHNGLLALKATKRILHTDIVRAKSSREWVATGLLQVLGTIVGILVVDKLGRRKTLIWSTIQIIIAQIALAIVLAVSTTSDTVTMSKVPAEASIVLVSPWLLIRPLCMPALRNIPPFFMHYAGITSGMLHLHSQCLQTRIDSMNLTSIVITASNIDRFLR